MPPPNIIFVFYISILRGNLVHQNPLGSKGYKQSVPNTHRITQHPPPSPFSNVNSAARVAASNTSSTPSPLKLEHSRYLRAPTSRATASPSCSVTKRRDFLRISSMATGSSRRSFLRPTRMIGTPGHFSVASSIHCCFLSKCQQRRLSTQAFPMILPRKKRGLTEC